MKFQKWKKYIVKRFSYKLEDLPNILTFFRLGLVPIFIVIFFSKITFHREMAALIFGISAITDFLDGYIARKYKSESKLGKLLDPIADKLLAISSLAVLVISKDIPLWVLEVLIVREATLIYGSALIIKKRDKIMAPSIWGKLATLLMLLGIFGALLKISMGKYLVYLGISVSIISGVDYILKGIRVLKS